MTSEQILSLIPPQKLNLLIGEVTSLMMLSKVHREMQIRDIADIILPPINLDQFRIYHNQKKEPIGFVTWGNFSNATLEKYLKGNALLTAEEWNDGDNLFFTQHGKHRKRVIKLYGKNARERFK